tara:strand:- start:50 stop:568 length:519 start_codon:yes stop_codon:yes gene_type:complete
MKKVVMSLLILIVSFSFVFAIPAPQPSDCEIKGIVEYIEFKEAWESDCLEDGEITENCLDGGFLSTPARYELMIFIEEITSLGESNCEGEVQGYRKDEGNVLYILEEDIEEIPRVGQIIEGVISRSDFDSYSLQVSLETKTSSYLIPYLIGAVVLLIIFVVFLLVLLKKKSK